MIGVSPQVPLAVSLPLSGLRLLLPKIVMGHDVLEIPKNGFLTNGLGVIAWNHAFVITGRTELVLMVQEHFLISAVDDDLPVTVWCFNHQIAVPQQIFELVLFTECIDCFLLFAKPHTHTGAAIAHPISCGAGLIGCVKRNTVVPVDPGVDFAVRKMKYFLSAFY